MAPDGTLRTGDLIPVDDPPEWFNNGFWGADCRTVRDIADFDARLGAFLDLLTFPDERTLFAWWREKTLVGGGVPHFPARWWAELPEFAARICMRELCEEGTTVRTRYIGAEIESRMKDNVRTGDPSHVATREEPEDFLKRLRPLFDEGRPRHSVVDMRILNRPFVRFSQLDLPFRLADGIRVNLALACFHD